MPPRKARFLYILAAEPDGYFVEMAAVSARTLLNATPGAEIIVLSDAQTLAASASPAAAMLRAMSQEWIVRDVDYATPVERSRWLKLKARDILDGPFVFLDTDTLIARDLSRLAADTDGFAAVADGAPEVLKMLSDYAAQKRWPLPKPYLNSGVFVASDTPAVRRLFETAFEIWREGAAEGVFSDQFAINVAAKRLEFPVRWLPATYNLQVLMRPSAAIKPHIYHVFTYDFENREDTILHRLAKSLKKTGNIDEAALAGFFADQNPWTNPVQPGELLALGRPVSAVLAKIRKMIGGGAP